MSIIQPLFSIPAHKYFLNQHHFLNVVKFHDKQEELKIEPSSH